MLNMKLIMGLVKRGLTRRGSLYPLRISSRFPPLVALTSTCRGNRLYRWPAAGSGELVSSDLDNLICY